MQLGVECRFTSVDGESRCAPLKPLKNELVPDVSMVPNVSIVPAVLAAETAAEAAVERKKASRPLFWSPFARICF